MQTDPYIYNLSRDHWAVIGIISQAIAALGTFAAVAISLWLAMRKPRPNVTLTARIRNLGDGMSLLPRTTIALEIDNADVQRICVKSVGCKIRVCAWHPRRFWTFHEWHYYPFSIDLRFHGASIGAPQSTPHAMEQGDMAKFHVGMETPEHWEDIVRGLGRNPRDLKFYALLLSGHVIEASAPDNCLGLVRKAYRNVNEQKSGNQL